MNNDLDNLYEQWTNATANLKWGQQKVFRDVLSAAQDGQTTLVYGTDYGNGGACLVNTVGVMLTTGGGNGIPMAHFGEVVSLFDRINGVLASMGVNTESNMVSPLAADILLMHFAPEREQTTEEVMAEAAAPTKYREPSDEAIADDLAKMFTQADVPIEINVDDNIHSFAVNEIDSPQ